MRLCQLHEDVDTLKDTIESVVKVTSIVCPESLDGKVSEALETVSYLLSLANYANIYT